MNASHHTKKAGEVRDALRKSQKLIAIKEQELAEERQEIFELESTWRNYEKQQQKKGASLRRDIELDEHQVGVLFLCIYLEQKVKYPQHKLYLV